MKPLTFVAESMRLNRQANYERYEMHKVYEANALQAASSDPRGPSGILFAMANGRTQWLNCRVNIPTVIFNYFE